jgi:hypothetical protein
MAYFNGPKLITSDLVACFDFSQSKCYASGAIFARNLADPSNNVYITGNSFVNSGIDSHIDTSNPNTVFVFNEPVIMGPTGGFTFLLIASPQTQSSASWNYFFQVGGGGAHNYEMGQFGTSAGFLFKDNVDSAGTTLQSANSSQWTMFCFGATVSGQSFSRTVRQTSKVYSSSTGWQSGAQMNVSHLFRDNASGGSYYSCLCNYVAMYDRELSNDEISQDFNALAGRCGL